MPRALTFNGSTSKVTIENYFKYRFGNFTNYKDFNYWDFTFMAWVNPFYLDKTDRYIIRDTNVLEGYIQIHYDRIQAKWKRSTSPREVINYYIHPECDRWYHFALRFRNIDTDPTYDEKKGIWKYRNWEVALFVDGNIVGSYRYIRNYTPDGPSGHFILGDKFCGLMSDVMAFSYALSDDEIRERMESGDVSSCDIYSNEDCMVCSVACDGIVYSGMELPGIAYEDHSNIIQTASPHRRAMRFVGKSYIRYVKIFTDLFAGFAMSSKRCPWSKYSMTYTAAMWIKPEYLGSQTAYIIRDIGGTSNRMEGWISLNMNKIQARHMYEDISLVSHDITLELGKWYHLCYTIETIEWDKKGYAYTYRIRLYLNANLIGETTWNRKHYNQGPDIDLYIGQYFHGVIDDVRLYYRALSREDILGIMHKQRGVLGVDGYCAFHSPLDEAGINSNTNGGYYISATHIPGKPCYCWSTYSEINLDRVPATSIDCEQARLQPYQSVPVNVYLDPNYSTDKYELSVSFDDPTAISEYHWDFAYTGDVVYGNPVLWLKASGKIGRYEATISNADGATVDMPIIIGKRVTKISLNRSTLNITKDAEFDLIPIIEPSDAVDKMITWVSSDPSIASVDDDGKVTANELGICNITCTTEDGNHVATCRVEVYIPVESVTIDRVNLTLEKGFAKQITATVSPSDATHKEVKWTSSNSAIASVNGTGLVSALHRGDTTVTVTTVDNNFKASCDVTVVDAGLAFFNEKWEQLNSYTKVLKYLDFDNFIGGQTTVPKKVFVKNQTDKKVKDVRLRIFNPQIEQSVVVQLSRTLYPFEPVEYLEFDGVLNEEGYYAFYVRLDTDEEAEGLTGEFDISGNFLYLE